MPEVITQTGPATVAPKPAAAPAPIPVVEAHPPAPKLDTAEELRRERIAQQRRLQKVETERQQERKTWGEKLTKAEADAKRVIELEKRLASFKRSSIAFSKAELGDAYWDTLVGEQIGGTPPAALVDARIEKLESDFDAKLAKRDADAKASSEQAQKQAEAQARQSLARESRQWYEANAEKLPSLKQFGDPSAVGSFIAQRIEQEYRKGLKYDAAGQLTHEPQMLSPEAAVKLIRADIRALAKLELSDEEFAAEVRGVLTPAKIPATIVKPQGSAAVTQPVQQRRTLSNDLTGSTPSRPASETPAQKRQRAIAAAEAARGKP